MNIDEILARIEIIENKLDLFAKHIEVLEKRSTKFSDKFKFGRFKFVKLSDEKIQKPTSKAKFSLNDD